MAENAAPPAELVELFQTTVLGCCIGSSVMGTREYLRLRNDDTRRLPQQANKNAVRLYTVWIIGRKASVGGVAVGCATAFFLGSKLWLTQEPFQLSKATSAGVAASGMGALFSAALPNMPRAARLRGACLGGLAGGILGAASEMLNEEVLRVVPEDVRSSLLSKPPNSSGRGPGGETSDPGADSLAAAIQSLQSSLEASQTTQLSHSGMDLNSLREYEKELQSNLKIAEEQGRPAHDIELKLVRIEEMKKQLKGNKM